MNVAVSERPIQPSMMDVSWTTTPRPEPFKRPNPADTLTRLASFIARAESKTGLSRSHRLPPPPQPAPCLNQIYRPPQLPQPAQSLPYPCVESHPGLSQLYMPPQTLQLAPSLPYPCAELNPSLNQIYRPLQTLPSLNQIYRTPNPPQPALNLPYPYVDLGPSLNQIYRPQQAPPSLPYQDCSLQFTYPTQLLTHQDLQHNLPKPYRCQHCVSPFAQEQVPSHQEAGNDIIKKLETNSPEKSLTSDDDSSSSQYMEGEDMKTVPKLRITAWKDRAVKKKVGGESLEEEEEFACASCPEVFAQLSELLAHAELHQTATVRGSCSVCTCEMDASSQWAEKMRLYHCGLCQRGFVALENFLSHCQEHLKNKVEDEGISEAIICEKS
uniref:C2H2-type domain-containing protein n=1 Tax=Knipowitschia caucasica TaxID=637954 RepID=A0AAV2M0L4_KNICA